MYHIIINENPYYTLLILLFIVIKNLHVISYILASIIQ